MNKRRESEVTSVELGIGKKIPRKEKPITTAQRVENLPKVTLKKKPLVKDQSDKVNDLIDKQMFFGK